MRYFVIFVALPLLGQSVLTSAYSNSRINASSVETRLTPTTAVNLTLLGKMNSTTSEKFWGQPLIVEGVSISGATRVMVACDANNEVHAFNADPPFNLLWSVHLATASTTTWALGVFYNGPLGCLPTPVIDATAGIIYLIALDSTPNWKIYFLNLVDGSTNHAAVTISGSDGGQTFSASRETIRTALTLANGNLYFATGNPGDSEPYYGFLFTCSVSAYTCVTKALAPGSSMDPPGGGGVFSKGAGFVVDGSGNLLIQVGNGQYDGCTAMTNCGESVVRIPAAGTSFADSFTPANWSTNLNANDLDLGESQPMLLSSTRIIGGGKDGIIWLLDPTNLGGLQGSGGNVIQTFDTGLSPTVSADSSKSNRVFGAANSRLFAGGGGCIGGGLNVAEPIKAYTYGSTFTTTAVATSTGTYCSPGPTMVYSSNGSNAASGLLCAVTVATANYSTSIAGTLRCYDANSAGPTLTEVWNSDTVAGNALGNAMKFALPTISKGMIYVATMGSIVVYGLATSVSLGGNITIGGGVKLQ